MKDAKILLFLFMALFATSACNEQRTPREEAEEMIASANNVSEELILQVDPNFWQGRSKLATAVSDDASENVMDSLLLIREGEYRISVGNTDSARSSIQRMVAEQKGHIQGEELNDWGDRIALIMKIKVPSARFENAIGSLDKIGTIEHQVVHVQDVTGEWVDKDARLRSMRLMEERYLRLIERAGKVSELLEVERELGRVRADLESMEAQLRVLNDRVAMSSITITCLGPLKSDMGYFSKASIALGRGGRYFLSFLIAMLEVWPFILIIILALIGLKFNRGRSKKSTT